MTDQVENTTVKPGAPPRVAEPHEHFVELPRGCGSCCSPAARSSGCSRRSITEVTDDTILVPTVIIVGSFLVPVTMAAFALSRRREGYLTTEEVVLGFLAAGTLGVVTTALLETYLLPAAAGHVHRRRA